MSAIHFDPKKNHKILILETLKKASENLERKNPRQIKSRKNWLFSQKTILENCFILDRHLIQFESFKLILQTRNRASETSKRHFRGLVCSLQVWQKCQDFPKQKMNFDSRGLKLRKKWWIQRQLSVSWDFDESRWKPFFPGPLNTTRQHLSQGCHCAAGALEPSVKFANDQSSQRSNILSITRGELRSHATIDLSEHRAIRVQLYTDIIPAGCCADWLEVLIIISCMYVDQMFYLLLVSFRKMNNL